MILPDFQIRAYCEEGMVTPFDPSLVNPASLDIRLGEWLLIESVQSEELVPYPLKQHSEDNPYLMVPGQFALADSLELFDIPDGICAEFKLKSSRGREGLDHAKAGFCDPGWNGSRLTMEFKNNRQLWPVKLWPGKRVGQMKFSYMAAPPLRSYRETGRYNGDTTVQQSRG
jgi:dCTP deaminase